MSEFLIREIEKADIPTMVRIWNQNFKALTTANIKHKVDSLTKWWEDAPQRNYKFFGLFIDNRLRAFMILEYRPEALWLKKMAVFKKDRKKGYGNELLKICEKEAGDRKIYTEIKAENVDTINIVFKKGFTLLVFNEELDKYILEKIPQN